jgi:cob(I)alamin adenosyltransferase
VCRRAERSLVALAEVDELRPEILRYVNRLSDWLFVAARSLNAADGVEEIPW